MESQVFSLIRELNELLQNQHQDSERIHALSCETVNAMVAQTFWIAASLIEQDGKAGVNFSFEETEYSEYPMLSVWIPAEADTRPAMLEDAAEDDLIQVHGGIILQLLDSVRFDILFILSADEAEYIRFNILRQILIIAEHSEQYVSFSQVQALDTVEKWQDGLSVVDGFPVPVTFVRQLYGYCEDQKRISCCNLALVNLNDTNQYVMFIEFKCDYKQEAQQHFLKVQKMAKPWMPPYMELIYFDDSGTSTMDNIRELFNSQPSFYHQQHSTGWLARLKRKMRPPMPYLVRLTLTD
ncbi:hypothetical protein [Entomohabitans teleogrylli]|uniref:hypothetical protein n=1 Tax=Entomohabitans teleogrylli TaxID=1384589 RepID=UPI00073D6B9D|nr:hypothetical protein [Entomohabitans teleogrylli]